MSSPPQSTSLLVRFLDSFLQERNIKWILAAGMSILLGSSLLLVTSHWNDYTPLWQNLIVLGYSAAIYVAGEWSYHRLGLRRTGTVLQGLTVLLIPILFLVMRWIPDDKSVAGQWALFLATAGFSAYAARRIFAFVLRGEQPTFLMSYLILAIAGTFLPAMEPSWAPGVAAALWATFAVGAIKVSRHVFWLTEENRSPRIFGFFPIALLGAQFLFLFAAHPALHFDLEWVGLGCVLAAIPLATADAVARVYQQRTGDLVRPLPWPIVLPMIVGLILCAAGCVLAGVSVLPPNRPYALVLTAGLTAGLMALMARRTGKPAFVWAMLIGLTVAYNFSPMFFMDIVNELRQRGAAMVHETRLPFAFYGLTYLPLLSALAMASRRFTRNGSDLFARPMRDYAFGLTCLLWCLSLTHEKALFPVGLCLAAIAALQVRALRSWLALAPALLAWMTAASGLPVFTEKVLGDLTLANAEFECLVMAASGLFIVGRFGDAWLSRLFPPTFSANLRHVCQGASLAVGLTLAAAWFLPGPAQGDAVAGTFALGLLAIHAARWLNPWTSAAAILFGQAVAARALIATGVNPGEFLAHATLFLLGQWLLGRIAIRIVPERFATAIVQVNNHLCDGGLGLLAFGIYLPLFALDLAPAFGLPIPTASGDILWWHRILMAVWSLNWARQSRGWAGPSLAYAIVLGSAGSAWATLTDHSGWMRLPEIWAITGLGVLAATEWFARQHQAGRLAGYVRDPESVIRATTRLTDALFVAIALGSLLVFDWPIRTAGLLSLFGLAVMARLHRPGVFRIPLVILLNLHVLWAIVRVVCPGAEWSERFLVSGECRDLALPLAAAAASSLLAWRFLSLQGIEFWQIVAELFQWALRGLWLLGIAMSVTESKLAFDDAVLAGAAFTLMAAVELIAACRENHEGRVWIGTGILSFGVLYMIHFRVVAFHTGFGIFAILGVAVVLGWLRQWARHAPALAVLDRPLGSISFNLPLVSVAIGVGRHVYGGPMVWLGSNSLALLLAAAFYFWRGLEGKRKDLHVLAAVILNVALALLWTELDWLDPQFFMVPIGISVLAFVELLKAEIPERFHNPLRYAGALVILVSPTFHIVGGSWLYLLSLMVLSVAVSLVAIGLRVRALLYMGSAFLLADLTAMLVRGGIANANVLWIAGLLLGAGIIALGAYCERHRELLQSRMYLLAATLKTWE